MTPDARTLPANVAAELHRMRLAGDPRWTRYLIALRRRGYSYAALGNAAGVSRQRVFQITRDGDGDMAGMVLPMPPEVKAYPTGPQGARTGTPKPPRVIPESDVADLRRFWEGSASRRGGQDDDHPAERAHLFLIAHVTYLLRQGFTFADMSRAIEVDDRSFRTRMWRAGVHAGTARAS